MKTQRPGQVVLPRTTSQRGWSTDPVVVATGEASKRARRAWMKIAPPENWLLRDLDPIQMGTLQCMLEADARYRAAKAAANGATEAGRRS